MKPATFLIVALACLVGCERGTCRDYVLDVQVSGFCEWPAQRLEAEGGVAICRCPRETDGGGR